MNNVFESQSNKLKQKLTQNRHKQKTIKKKLLKSGGCDAVASASHVESLPRRTFSIDLYPLEFYKCLYVEHFVSIISLCHRIRCEVLFMLPLLPTEFSSGHVLFIYWFGDSIRVAVSACVVFLLKCGAFLAPCAFVAAVTCVFYISFSNNIWAAKFEYLPFSYGLPRLSDRLKHFYISTVWVNENFYWKSKISLWFMVTSREEYAEHSFFCVTARI